MTEATGDIGVPHPDVAEPDDFTGTDPAANIREPDALGADRTARPA